MVKCAWRWWLCAKLSSRINVSFMSSFALLAQQTPCSSCAHCILQAQVHAACNAHTTHARVMQQGRTRNRPPCASLHVNCPRQLLQAVEQQVALLERRLVLRILRVWPICLNDARHLHKTRAISSPAPCTSACRCQGCHMESRRPRAAVLDTPGLPLPGQVCGAAGRASSRWFRVLGCCWAGAAPCRSWPRRAPQR